MSKLSEAQVNALTAIHFAKAFTTGGFKVRPDSVRPNTQAALVRAGLVETYRDDSADLIRLTPEGEAALNPTPASEWPSGVVADGSVLALVDMSDQQAEALEDIKTVGWTPANRRTVESLIRHGLIVWVADSREPEMFTLTEEGARAYKAVTVRHVVPNRAARRRNVVKTITRAPRKARGPVTRAVRSLKPGERFFDRLGRVVTVAAKYENWAPGISIMVRTEDGDKVRAVFTERKARVTMSDDSPKVKAVSAFRLDRAYNLGGPVPVVVSGLTLTPKAYDDMATGEWPIRAGRRRGFDLYATVPA